MDAAIAQLLTFCHADPVFFEPLWRMDDRDSRFPVLRAPLPPGWRPSEQDVWVLLHPPGDPLPEQGWKIHVSSVPDDAESVCEQVVRFCLERELAVKYLRSRTAMRLLNSKYADRGSSGKLLTIYPRDEARFAEVLPELAALLRGRPGPYVLSDLRYEDGPVYVRYGAFRRMTFTGADGETVHAVRSPDGGLVPDVRGPVFTTPAWVTVPEVLRESLAQRDAGSADDFPFQIERPLHFSNGGGVYLARHEGRYVVLLEARPHAGLDATGRDAVARLHHERAVLERLHGLDCVPQLLGHRVLWEHHFLVEEYVEGTTLMEEVFARYPLAGPTATAEAMAAYVQWATDVLAKVDHALMAIHARGLRFTDLHPANVIVRPDGRVALVDFEIATDLDDERPAGLAAPGFTAPPGLSGRDADRYVLNCLRQWVFLPISPLPDRDPVKLRGLTNVITELFPLPEAFGRRMVRRFEAGRGPIGEDEAARRFDAPDLTAIRASLVAGLHAMATPERTDRLFPGDPQLHACGGTTVAHGAAGVLWAMHRAGAPVPPEYVDWLVTAVRRNRASARPGLLDGLHGVALTLAALGRHDDALNTLDRARRLPLITPGLHGGLAGAVLSLLAFDELDEAIAVGEQLAVRLDGELPRVGLQHGRTGIALSFLRLHDHTADERYLDLARTALRAEIERGQVLPDGSFQLLEANRYHAYLSTGSIGLALVIDRYLAHRAERGFADVIDGARLACRAPFIRHPFLLMGRAGTIAALHLLGRDDDRAHVEAHTRRLGWHALSYQGHLAFPGNQLLRLSADLATGAAGVLVALAVAAGDTTAVLPGLDLRPPLAPEGGEHHGLRALPASAQHA